MNNEDVRKLTRAVGKEARIVTTQGETLVAKVLWVDEEHREVTYDLISTTTPDWYQEIKKSRPNSAFVIPFDYISQIDVKDEVSS